MSTLTKELASLLLDELFVDSDKLHKLFLIKNRVLTVQDVAFLLGRDVRTVNTWDEQQKYGLRMNRGKDGHKTMLYKDFVTWYESQYQKPAPKL